MIVEQRDKRSNFFEKTDVSIPALLSEKMAPYGSGTVQSKLCRFHVG